MKQTFAVINQWPDFPNAEQENIARLQVAAKKLGLNCILIDKWGRRLDNQIELTHDNIDFVIHLHFETAKCYDAFSYVTLWCPLHSFYQSHLGYHQCAVHMSSHDDALSCHSSWVDDYYCRQIFDDASRLPPSLYLNHTLTSVIPPRLSTDRKLFYCGTNWERLGGGKGRLDDVLKALDKVGLVKIYGPKKVKGVDVWKGYQSYVKPIPFDGITTVEEIAQCGISLVFSSRAHVYSGLMTNRLFESAAAGAVILVDDNIFAKNFFGDAVIYINMKQSQERINQEIIEKIYWINAHPEEAYQLALKAQKIFLEKFDLAKQLEYLYTHHAARKQELAKCYLAQKQNYRVQILHRFRTKEVLVNLVKNLKLQSYTHFQLNILFDVGPSVVIDSEFKQLLEGLSVQFIENINTQVAWGEILFEIRKSIQQDDLFLCIDDERLYHDHLSSLVRKFEDNDNLIVAMSDVIAKKNGLEKIYFRQAELKEAMRHTLVLMSGTLSSALFKIMPLLDEEAIFWKYLEELLPYYLALAYPQTLAFTRRGTVEIIKRNLDIEVRNHLLVQNILTIEQQLRIIEDRFSDFVLHQELAVEVQQLNNFIKAIFVQIFRVLYAKTKKHKMLFFVNNFFKKLYYKFN